MSYYALGTQIAMLFQKSEIYAGTLPDRIEPLADFLNHERIPTGEKSPPKIGGRRLV